MDANGVSMNDNEVRPYNHSVQGKFINDLTELLKSYNSYRGHRVLGLKLVINAPSENATYEWQENELHCTRLY
jgi:hypothetical protein